MAAICFFVSFLMPTIMRKAAVKQIAASLGTDKTEKSAEQALKRSWEAFQTSTIVGYALIEGAAFANLMLWFLESSIFSLAMVGISVALMAIMFPVDGRIISAVETMLEDVKNDGKFGV